MDQRSPSIRVELEHAQPPEPISDPSRSTRRTAAVLVTAALLVTTMVGFTVLGSGQSTDPSELPGSALPSSGSDPSGVGDRESDAASLRALIERVGGLGAMSAGTATGAFEIVSFDPLDTNRLLATQRDGYGDAENQSKNEIWELDGRTVDQQIWNPNVSHDYAHFNVDGTTTMWVHSGEDVGYAARRSMVLDSQWTPIRFNSPIYAARSVTVGGTVFALTGSSDFYDSDARYRDVVALGANGPTVLADGSGFEWISAPSVEIVVAYPTSDAGRTVVFDVNTLERLDGHSLSGRRFARAAISGDGRSAVGIRFDGVMERIDMASGEVTATFGSLEPAAIERPIELDREGVIAVTIDRLGVVDVWWVGDDVPLASIEGEIGIPRWLSERRASRPSSTIAPDASRVALRVKATPTTEIRWEILETSADAWLSRLDRATN